MENESKEFPHQGEEITEAQSTNITDSENNTDAKLSNSAESKAKDVKPKRRPGRPRKNPPPEEDNKKDVIASESEEQAGEAAEPALEIASNEQTVAGDISDTVVNESSDTVEDESSDAVEIEEAIENTVPESTESADSVEDEFPSEKEGSLIDALLQKDEGAYITEEEADEADDGMYALPFDEPEETLENAPEPEKEEEDDETELPPYNPDKPRRIDARFDLVELFIITLAIVMIISSFFFRHTVVDGASMEKTLYDREHLIISDVFYTPKRGDIIVFADYTTSVKKNLVKRVIAIEGDKVKITRDGEVMVNGKVLDEDYVNIDKPGYTYRPLEITVPAGELFVMGDHRNESIDSRDPYVGTISEDAVLGRVLIRIFPFREFGNPDRKKDE